MQCKHYRDSVLYLGMWFLIFSSNYLLYYTAADWIVMYVSYEFEFQVILLQGRIIFICSLSEIKKELIVWQEE